MSKGIKFRRNNKSILTDIQEGEIVYAIDTDEWGLGLNDDTVSWRKHLPLTFENHTLKGNGSPDNSLGDIGQYYIDLNNGNFYQKQQSGWEIVPEAVDPSTLTGYIPVGSVPGFDDTSTIILSDGSVSLPNGWTPTDPKEPIDKASVDIAASQISMRTDGSTEMVDGYIPLNGDSVVTKGNTESEELKFKPVTTSPDFGYLWNDNGVPRVRTPWDQEALELFQPSPASDDRFGADIVISEINDRIFVAAPNDTSNGTIFGYDLNRNKVVEINHPEDSFGSIGRGLEIIGDKLFISFSQDNDLGNSSGSVIVYDMDGNYQFKILAPDGTTSDMFSGYEAMDSSSTYLAVGSRGADPGSISWAGRAYVFNSSGTFINSYIEPTPIANNYFGSAVAVNETHVAISATGNDSDGTDVGKVYLFEIGGNLIRTITSPITTDSFNFGAHMVLSDSYLVICGATDKYIFIYDELGNYLRTVEITYFDPWIGHGGMVIDGDLLVINDSSEAKISFIDLSTGIINKTLDLGQAWNGSMDYENDILVYSYENAYNYGHAYMRRK